MNIIHIQESILKGLFLIEHIIQDDTGLYAEISLSDKNDLLVEKDNENILVLNLRKQLKDLSSAVISNRNIHINKNEYILFSSCILSEKIESISPLLKETLADYFLKHNYIAIDGMSFISKDNILRIPLLPIPF